MKMMCKLVCINGALIVINNNYILINIDLKHLLLSSFVVCVRKIETNKIVKKINGETQLGMHSKRIRLKRRKRI